jgi:hypothetical protein
MLGKTATGHPVFAIQSYVTEFHSVRGQMMDRNRTKGKESRIKK